MHHRRLPLLFAALVAIVLMLAPTALAIRVHVRVEGKNVTIFGATEPLLAPVVGPVSASDGTTVELTQPTPLGALEAASIRSEFAYVLLNTSFGPYVSQIGRHGGVGASGWVYKVNGAMPPVGADSYLLEDGDTVLWYYATFGPEGGPATLDLVRSGPGCYRAIAVDDLGERTRARRVYFLLDGRRIYSFGGRICPQGDWDELRATKDGFVRSEVVVNS